MSDKLPFDSSSREGRSSVRDELHIPPLRSMSPVPCLARLVHHVKDMKKLMKNWYQPPEKYDSQPMEDMVRIRETYKLQQKIIEVLDEAIHLSDRLEADRQIALKALLKEREKRKILLGKFETVQTETRQEYLATVQKEEETQQKVIELAESHLTVEKKKLSQYKEELSNAETYNHTLQEEVNVARQQVCTLKEDLKQQEEIIETLKAKQDEADIVCLKAKNDLEQAQKTLEGIQTESKNIQLYMQNVLQPIRQRMGLKMEDLSHLMDREKDLLVEIREVEMSIDLIFKKCAEVTKRSPEIDELEKAEMEKITVLKSQVEEMKEKFKNVKSLKEAVDRTKQNAEAEAIQIEELVHSKCQTFSNILKQNTDYQLGIENYQVKISESEKSLKQIREEMEYLIMNFAYIEEQQKKSAKELMQVSTQHRETQNELEEQRQMSITQENRARADLDQLQKQLHTLTRLLETRRVEIMHINKKMQVHHKLSERACQKQTKELEEITTKSKELEDSIKKMEVLRDELDKMQSEQKQAHTHLEESLKEKCEKLQEASELHESTIKRYYVVVRLISDFRREYKTLDLASDILQKEVDILQKDTAERQADFNVVHFKHKAATHLMDLLESDLINCRERIRRSFLTHATLVALRRKQLRDTDEALVKALEDNKRLAIEYEKLQHIIVAEKRNALLALTDQNAAQQVFNYYERLSLMQKRMHKALKKYLKQRSYQSQTDLNRCQTLSKDTFRRMKVDEEKMCKEIYLISEFLGSLGEASSAIENIGMQEGVDPEDDE